MGYQRIEIDKLLCTVLLYSPGIKEDEELHIIQVQYKSDLPQVCIFVQVPKYEVYFYNYYFLFLKSTVFIIG